MRVPSNRAVREIVDQRTSEQNRLDTSASPRSERTQLLTVNSAELRERARQVVAASRELRARSVFLRSSSFRVWPTPGFAPAR
jgi:hypothetical protein